MTTEPTELEVLTTRATELDDQLAVIYRELRPLRVRIAELRGPAILPKRRNQTAVQNRVANCPRCGDGYLGEPAA